MILSSFAFFSQLKRPSIRTSSGTSLYMQNPLPLRLATKKNLLLPINSLMKNQPKNDNFLIVTDENLPVYMRLQVTFLYNS